MTGSSYGWIGRGIICSHEMPQGHLIKVTVANQAGRLVTYQAGMDLTLLSKEAVVAASPALKMREVLEIRRATGSPLVLMQSNKMVGVVGDDEIYSGLLRQIQSAN